jgi:hypothetical protein
MILAVMPLPLTGMDKESIPLLVQKLSLAT